MLSENINTALNKQIRIESESSQLYLSMACWAESHGFEGVADFLYDHSEEERQHMLKLIKFVNVRGGEVIISELTKPKKDFQNIKELFQDLLDHEIYVSSQINELVHITFEEKDYATHNFLQWYVSEQIEEEALARSIIDKMSLIGENESSLYLFDNEIRTIRESNTKKQDAI